jgi:acyl carrier protein
MTALDQVVVLLREVTDDPGLPIDPATRLDADLRLDSLEVAALAARLRWLPGAPDLLGHLAELDLDQLIALTVGDLARLVAP